MRIKNKTKIKQHTRWFVMYPFERAMVFDATFNNTSVISWWSILLVEETGVPGPVASH